jgi:hypothetical protein
MGGADMTWRLVRQSLLLVTVAAVAAVAIAPAVASTGGTVEPSGAASAPVHRLALAASSSIGADTTFTATLEASTDGGAGWAPAAGETVTFAYVTDGAGHVSAVNGGPIGSMSCVTDGAGKCTITVHTDAPGDAVVTAVSRSASASSVVA